MILENRPIVVDGPGGAQRVSINGENLFIDDLASASSRRTIIDVDYEVNAQEDLDIELRLAYFDNRLSLYWKETFQNRLYRQGLFHVEVPRLRFVCAGQGGRHVER